MSDEAWRELERQWERDRDPVVLERLIQARRRAGVGVPASVFREWVKPGRRFESELKVSVFFELPVDAPGTDPFALDVKVAEVASTDGVFEIPGHRAWWVRPHDKRRLARYVPELRDQHVRGLELDRSRVGAEEISVLAELSQLDWLSLKSCAEVSDDALLGLAAFEQLETLDLTGTRFAGSGLRGLSKLERLWRLDLSRQTMLEDEGLAHLPRNLNRIDLRQSKKISDAGIAHLSRLQGLERLILDGCRRVTDEAVRVVSLIPSIREVSLRGCPKVTGAALEHLAKAPGLRAIEIGITTVKYPEIEAFAKARPDVHSGQGPHLYPDTPL